MISSQELYLNICKSLVPNKVTFWGFRWAYILQGHYSTYSVCVGSWWKIMWCHNLFCTCLCSSELGFSTIFCVHFCHDMLWLLDGTWTFLQKKKIILCFKSTLIRARIEMYAHFHMCIYVRICLCICVCAYSCVCVYTLTPTYVWIKGKIRHNVLSVQSH